MLTSRFFTQLHWEQTWIVSASSVGSQHTRTWPYYLRPSRHSCSTVGQLCLPHLCPLFLYIYIFPVVSVLIQIITISHLEDPGFLFGLACFSCNRFTASCKTKHIYITLLLNTFVWLAFRIVLGKMIFHLYLSLSLFLCPQPGISCLFAPAFCSSFLAWRTSLL